MFSFYWPGKRVPDWLESVEFSGTSSGVPTLRHSGFGVVISRGGQYHVYPFAGSFVTCDAAGMDVHIKGGGKGVVFHTSQPLLRR
jgi:hypothetical protein